MFDKDKLESIFDMLTTLTESCDCKWSIKKGLITGEFFGNLYEIDPLLFTIDGSPVCTVPFSKEAMEFYTYLNTKVLGDSIIDKLDKACDNKFLG
jgi:hypothetical protein